MDAEGRIYRGENVPDEDKARLDGYLRGRAEEAVLREDIAAKYEAKLRELEASGHDRPDEQEATP